MVEPDPPGCGVPAADGTACARPDPPALPEEPAPTKGVGRLWHLLVGIDPRSLAVFRVALALVLLVDLVIRAQNLDAFYTDSGVFTCADARHAAVGTAVWSLHWWCGAAWYQALLFGLAGLAALALLVGYHARLAAFVSWALLVSLHGRNPQVLQGGDVLLRCLVFWAMLLPLGARFSLDRARIPLGQPPPRRAVASVAAAALLVQVCCMYWFTAALKTAPDWRQTHTAVYFALSIEQLSTPFGEWLLHYPHLLRALTAATMVQERWGPWLVFVPGLLAALVSWRLAERAVLLGRLLAVGSFAGFHLGLFSSMELGPFPFICWTAWLPFIPAAVWDALAARWAARRPGELTIYFDGACGFCRSMLGIMRAFWLLPPHRVTPALEDPAIDALMRQENSWVVVTPDGQRHLRYQGILRLVERSALLFPFAPLARWRPLATLGDRLYRAVAVRRAGGSRLLAWLRPRPYRVEFRPWAQIPLDLLAGLLLWYVLLWNWRTLHANSDFDQFARRWYPTGYNWILELPRLDQYWSMFSPMPLRDDGWYIAAATLADGRQVDLLTGRPPTDAKPAHLARRYHDERWRKYLMNLYTDDYRDDPKDPHKHFRHAYASYLARTWDRRHPAPGDQVVSVALWFWKKTNRLEAPPLYAKQLLVQAVFVHAAPAPAAAATPH